jgi:hypothetical protein
MKEKEPHGFCETPEVKCGMNYCNENGCQNRKRNLVEPTEQDNWISVEERLPHCLESGNWDGRRSDFVIVEDVDGLPHIGRLYSGHIDGTDFNDWYDNKDCELRNIVKWKKINP